MRLPVTNRPVEAPSRLHWRHLFLLKPPLSNQSIQGRPDGLRRCRIGVRTVVADHSRGQWWQRNGLSVRIRNVEASVIAPFEYTALPLAIFWGWWFFDELPDAMVMLGIFLIGVSGVYVFVRERRLSRQVAGGRPVRRT